MAKAHSKIGCIAQMIDIRKTNIENDFKEVFAQFHSGNILINPALDQYHPRLI